MDPDSPETKRRRLSDTASLFTSAEFQHQSQRHNLHAKTAKTEFEPPSTSGTSSGDFQLYTAPSGNPATITTPSPIRFEDFLTETTRETPPRPDESEEAGPSNREEAEEDVSVSARERHNNIGRRYRNKLNENFEHLQALLSLQEDDDNGDRDSTARDASSSPTQTRKRRKGRGINKASLLEMAKVRIETLTEQRDMLIAEVAQLEKELALAAVEKQASRTEHEEDHDETY
ncbi:hypothetical protein QBC32DRAFT_271094 [Pseudoneurospora amorphoporcata]|uniref:BHLH domain-containing protein n=1 Tax=Pseudoneurospora amorphoporcata TaxID=241081 RepID=A0AAN6NKL5_9PEZI|nr:hypothetical protein QBC32DRAFT_271094 [Pseudoneurospora amorphoporcata]